MDAQSAFVDGRSRPNGFDQFIFTDDLPSSRN
jgi:hypothetical protein